jgi:hypothetical protein
VHTAFKASKGKLEANVCSLQAFENIVRWGQSWREGRRKASSLPCPTADPPESKSLSLNLGCIKAAMACSERIAFVLIDGIGDVNIPALGQRTPLQAAGIPCMDAVAGHPEVLACLTAPCPAPWRMLA